MARATLLLLLPFVLAAQADLREWQIPPAMRTSGYAAETRQEGCRSSFCSVLRPDGRASGAGFGTLMQKLDAGPYRGRKISLRAWIRVEPGPSHPSAQMFLRVLRKNGQLGFYDDMGDRPVTAAEWRRYEITGEIAADAQSIEIGVLSFDLAQVWVDGLEFAVGSPLDARETGARREIEALYARIDAGYAHGSIAESSQVALPDAQIVLKQHATPLAAAMADIEAQMRHGARIQSRSSLTAADIGADLATVWVNNDSVLSGGPYAADAVEVITASRDTWARTPEGWRLKKTVMISSRSVTPRTDADTTRAVGAEIRKHAVPLYDDAVTQAVGDARIVALGEATHGTSEFYTINQRVFENMVRTKGFTVLAIEANWPESLAVDRYITTGEGDPRKALEGMNFWTWYTEEMLKLIEWMRAYNQSPGKHATLHFTSFDMQSGRGAADRALDYLKEYAPDLASVAEAAFAAAYDVEIARVPDEGHAEAAAARVSAVAHAMDTRHRELTGQSGEEKWSAARQAAAYVLEACTFRIPGKGGAYREQAMAANVEWIAGTQFPREKIVLWAHNAHVRAAGEPKSMGAFLRERFGRQLYIVGYAFRRGGLRAKGPRGGTAADVAVFEAPPSPEGSGDAVLSAGGLPLFFLNFAVVPAENALGRWLAEPHSFHRVGSSWWADDPEANFETGVLRKQYDGLIFVEQGHAARTL